MAAGAPAGCDAAGGMPGTCGCGRPSTLQWAVGTAGRRAAGAAGQRAAGSDPVVATERYDTGARRATAPWPSSPAPLPAPLPPPVRVPCAGRHVRRRVHAGDGYDAYRYRRDARVRDACTPSLWSSRRSRALMILRAYMMRASGTPLGATDARALEHGQWSCHQHHWYHWYHWYRWYRYRYQSDDHHRAADACTRSRRWRHGGGSANRTAIPVLVPVTVGQAARASSVPPPSSPGSGHHARCAASATPVATGTSSWHALRQHSGGSGPAVAADIHVATPPRAAGATCPDLPTSNWLAERRRPAHGLGTTAPRCAHR